MTEKTNVTNGQFLNKEQNSNFDTLFSGKKMCVWCCNSGNFLELKAMAIL